MTLQKSLIIAAFCAALWSLAGCVVCIICGSATWAIACVCIAVWLTFYGIREADDLREETAWQEARRHPRL